MKLADAPAQSAHLQPRLRAWRLHHACGSDSRRNYPITVRKRMMWIFPVRFALVCQMPPMPEQQLSQSGYKNIEDYQMPYSSYKHAGDNFPLVGHRPAPDNPPSSSYRYLGFLRG